MSDPISILSESTSVRGRVSGEGDLEVRGRVEGELEVTGTLTIAEGAIVRAGVRAATVVIRGAVRGDISASEVVVLEESARVLGNVTAGRVAIASGAQFRGAIDMGGEFSVAKSDATSARHAKPTAAARPVVAARPAAVPARAPAPVARAPFPPARVAVPVPVPARRPAPVAIEAASDEDEPADSAEPAATIGESARREPPLPLVPSIKKGAKAAPAKRKGGMP